MRTKTPLKRSLLVIAAVLVATLAVYAQSATVGKLYKNEQEKKELVSAIMQDQELKAELRDRLMEDKEGCSRMMVEYSR
jgi:formiminotetrahydrofolate cyclodeaminase